MGSPITSLNCSIRHDGARLLSWTLQPHITYTDSMRLQVENSRTGDDWTVLATDVLGQCMWVDSRRRNYNKRMNECYRLRLIVPDNHEEFVSSVVDAGNHKAYPYSQEAENVITQVEKAIQMSGCKGQLLKKRLWGPRCPLCVDFTGQATVNEHCPRCLGTGIDGGYFPGIGLDIIKDSISTAEAPAELGYMQGETVKARCIAYPWINYGDVWVEDGTDKRYYITQITPASSYRQTNLIYALSMNLVELNDVLHSKHADHKADMNTVWESGEPHRTQPVTYTDQPGQSKDGEWDDILAGL